MKQSIKVVLAFAIIGGAMNVIALLAKRAPAPTTSLPYVRTDPEASHRSIVANIKLEKVQLSKGGLATVGSVSFSIRNDNDFEVRDIDIRCEFWEKSGGAIGESRKTVHGTVKAKSTKVVNNFNLGFINPQATRGGCEVTDVQP